jgi:hypothetical protein
MKQMPWMASLCRRRTNSVNNPEREIISSAAKSRPRAFLLIRPWQRTLYINWYAARLHQLLQGHLKNASLVG